MNHANKSRKRNADSETIAGSFSPSGTSQTASSTSQLGNSPSSMSSPAISTSSRSSTRPPKPLKAPKRTFCDDCRRDYRTTSNYGKHRRDVHDRIRHACHFHRCGKTFQRKKTLEDHRRRRHLNLGIMDQPPNRITMDHIT
ncbi:hypothetical protein F4810DRAFT_404189 [Camillea tinctor]|nr:hypothetical protein F4810DRAFT_404189 [Camillea tinctor]